MKFKCGNPIWVIQRGGINHERRKAAIFVRYSFFGGVAVAYIGGGGETVPRWRVEEREDRQ